MTFIGEENALWFKGLLHIGLRRFKGHKLHLTCRWHKDTVRSAALGVLGLHLQQQPAPPLFDKLNCKKLTDSNEIELVIRPVFQLTV